MTTPAGRFAWIAAILIGLMVFARRWPRGSLPDFQIHDTYFVVAPSSILFVMALVAILFAITYYLVPTGARAVGAHFWLTVVGLAGFWSSFYIFVFIVQRSIETHSAMPAAQLATLIVFTISAFMVLASPLFFLFNVTMALSKRLRTAR
jgi:heme/copper-type cytochrome/quinol oxidase subunit 1